MEYKVIDVQFGLYNCDTIFIQVGNDIFQVPIDKRIKITRELIDKKIIIENLYNVPLTEVNLVKK